MEEEKEVVEVSYAKIVPVRFHPGEKTYSFGTNSDNIHKNDEVVVETVRGLEIGTVMGEPTEGKPELDSVIKPVIRVATAGDLAQRERNRQDEAGAMEKCREAIDQCELPMVLTSAEYTLDRSKIVFTYVAEERVDFRELLKVLASIFHTRIELRQIGPRDKAKMVGGIGICGMPLCCNRFQKDFGTISINMAKNQLLALNPQKLSGQCGKLMCCLAYENEDYKVLRQGLPKMNASVIYNGNRYRITSMNVLDNSARLSNSMEVVDMSLDDLKALIKFNEEHDINIQNFMKAQREREIAARNQEESSEKDKETRRPTRQRVDLREKKEEPVIEEPAEEIKAEPEQETKPEPREKKDRNNQRRDRNQRNHRNDQRSEQRGEGRQNRPERRSERPETENGQENSEQNAERRPQRPDRNRRNDRRNDRRGPRRQGNRERRNETPKTEGE